VSEWSGREAASGVPESAREPVSGIPSWACGARPLTRTSARGGGVEFGEVEGVVAGCHDGFMAGTHTVNGTQRTAVHRTVV
jgi:hypothetical protein